MREANPFRGTPRRPALRSPPPPRPWWRSLVRSRPLPLPLILPLRLSLRLPLSLPLSLPALLLLLLLAVGWPQAAKAAQAAPPAVLELDASAQRFDAWQAVKVLSDPGHALSLEDVVARSADFQVPDVPKANFGPRAETIWLHVPVRARIADRWIVEVDYPPLNRVEAWVMVDGQLLRHVLMGSDTPVAQRPSRSRAHIFAVDLRPGPVHDLYLRIDSATTMVTPIRLHREAGFVAYESMRMLLLGLIFGATSLLLATTFINGISLRDPAYFFYALMLLGITMFFVSYSGLGHQFFWSTQKGFFEKVSPIGALIALTAASFFVISALNMHERNPLLARSLQVTALCALASIIAAAVGLLNYRQSSVAATILGPIQIALALSESVRQAREGSRMAVYMVIGWGAYAIGSFSLALLLRGKIPVDFLTQNLFQFSSLVEMLAWMRVLAIRIEVIRLDADRIGAEKQALHALAHTDPLTGLLNRRGLVHEIETALARPDSSFALYLIDLDRFKAVNDQLGHEAGDETLVRVSRRLREVLRDDDILARLGGDEFVVLAAGLSDRPTAMTIGDKMLDAIVEPFELSDGRPIVIGATIGLALAPEEGGQADTLLRAADSAMYAGKSEGRHCVSQGMVRESPATH